MQNSPIFRTTLRLFIILLLCHVIDFSDANRFATKHKQHHHQQHPEKRNSSVITTAGGGGWWGNDGSVYYPEDNNQVTSKKNKKSDSSKGQTAMNSLLAFVKSRNYTISESSYKSEYNGKIYYHGSKYYKNVSNSKQITCYFTPNSMYNVTYLDSREPVTEIVFECTEYENCSELLCSSKSAWWIIMLIVVSMVVIGMLIFGPKCWSKRNEENENKMYA